MKDTINNVRKSDTWKIQLTIAISFMFSIDNDEERKMDSNCGVIEIMINNKEDTVIEELFQSLLSRHKIGLETSMKGRDLINVIYDITNAIK